MDFWKDINALPEPQLGTAYTLGVVLQNVETDILRLIDHQVRDAHAAWGPPTDRKSVV